MSRLNADIALLLAAAIWGVAFLFQKSAMDHVGPLAFIAARGLVAAVALLPFALREHRRAAVRTSGRLWGVAIGGGFAFFAAAWLQQTGLVTATVTNTGFLTALYVVLTPFGTEILYVGLLSSALTFTILTVALQYTPPSEAAVIVSLETVFAALAAYLVLGERLTAVGWFGAALILLATLTLQLGTAVAPRPGRADTAAPPDQ